MATPKKTKTKAVKVGSYRGGTKTSVGGRGGFLGKTTSGGNLGRAAMTNAGSAAAAKAYGRTSGADAVAFGIGGSAGGAKGNAGGVAGIVSDNTSGAGVDYSSDGLIESVLNPGGRPYSGQVNNPNPNPGVIADPVSIPGWDVPAQAPSAAPSAAVMRTPTVAAPTPSGTSGTVGTKVVAPTVAPKTASTVSVAPKTTAPTTTRVYEPTPTATTSKTPTPVMTSGGSPISIRGMTISTIPLPPKTTTTTPKPLPLKTNTTPIKL